MIKVHIHNMHIFFKPIFLSGNKIIEYICVNSIHDDTKLGQPKSRVISFLNIASTLSTGCMEF